MKDYSSTRKQDLIFLFETFINYLWFWVKSSKNFTSIVWLKHTQVFFNNFIDCQVIFFCTYCAYFLLCHVVMHQHTTFFYQSAFCNNHCLFRHHQFVLKVYGAGFNMNPHGSCVMLLLEKTDKNVSRGWHGNKTHSTSLCVSNSPGIQINVELTHNCVFNVALQLYRLLFLFCLP